MDFNAFQGRKWCIDEQFQTTSASVSGKTFYVKDLVEYKIDETIRYGIIDGFYMKVLILLMCLIG